jgi:8-oxo-dGTP pyrophosphatase MutT (NUDIX family)
MKKNSIKLYMNVFLVTALLGSSSYAMDLRSHRHPVRLRSLNDAAIEQGYSSYLAKSQQTPHFICQLGNISIGNNPRKHCVFFDIDGVLLNKDKYLPQKDLLSDDTLKAVLALQQKGVQCFALTARTSTMYKETFSQLSKYGLNFSHPGLNINFVQEGTKYFKGILFSPNIHATGGKTSTKLQTLQSFVQHLKDIGANISRVSFVDNERFHFDKIPLFQDTLHLYHYEREFDPLYRSSSKDFVPAFENLEFVKTCEGGSGGVVVFQDKTTGKKWTLKSWENKPHGINECLGGLLYQALSGHIPHFCLFNDIPESLMNKIPKSSSQNSGLYRLAEFVEGEHPTEQELLAHLKEHFVPLAFLSFWDIKPDNFILTPQNQLYLIDTGGSLSYRALGSKKQSQDNWMSHQVSEFRTFREGATYGAQYFSEIPNKALSLPIKSILKNFERTLKQARAFCQAVRYENTREILEFLELRRQHFQFLSHFLDGKINPQSGPFDLASLNDAAGTLIYCLKGGKLHILLGKRRGHNWYGNLGGKADAGETFYETATRETKEESGGQFDFQNQILFMPSHDLITVDKYLMTTCFRTYLAKGEFVEKTDLMAKLQNSRYEKEYTDFVWMPIEDLCAALDSMQVIQEENQKTIVVGKMILHPPFLESLKQPQIRGWLESLKKGEHIPETCTKSIAGHPHLTITNDENHESSVSQHKRMALWLSLAAGNKQNKSTAQKTKLPEVTNIKTASHAMLKRLGGEKISTMTLEDQIKNVVAKQSRNIHLDNEKTQLIKSIIDQEKVHGDKLFLYHGLRPDIWFNFLVLSTIRKTLDGSPIQTDVLRSKDSYFDDHQNAQDLLNFILKGNNNYSDGFQRVGISCNPTLFSNMNCSTSSTLEYFLTGDSKHPPQNPFAITEVVFKDLGIPHDLLMRQLQEIYNQHFSHGSKGVLLQFLLDPNIVNQVCYIAQSMGAAVYNQNGSAVRDSLKILNDLKNGVDPQLKSNVDALQVRLHADLAKFPIGSVVVKEHFVNPSTDLSAIQMELNRVLSPYLFSLLEKQNYNNEIYASNPPQTLQVLRKISHVNPYEYQILQEPEIIRHYRDENYFTVLRMLAEDPFCLKQECHNPDSLQVVFVENNKDIRNIHGELQKLGQIGLKYALIAETLYSGKKISREAFLCELMLVKESMPHLAEENLNRINNADIFNLLQNSKSFLTKISDKYASFVVLLISLVTNEDLPHFFETILKLTGQEQTNYKIVKRMAFLKNKEDREHVSKLCLSLSANMKNTYHVDAIIKAMAGIQNKEDREHVSKLCSSLIVIVKDDYSKQKIIKIMAGIQNKEDREHVSQVFQHIIDGIKWKKTVWFTEILENIANLKTSQDRVFVKNKVLSSIQAMDHNYTLYQRILEAVDEVNKRPQSISCTIF